jgi:hypothetical protein
MRLQSVPPVAPDYKLVIDMARLVIGGRGGGHGNGEFCEPGAVQVGIPLAPVRPLIEVRKLHAQDGGLEGIQA